MATTHCIRDIHARIYQNLLKVVPDLLAIKEHGKSVVSGYMDLNLDVLERTPAKIVLALSHYYRQSGDMIADPDMEIAVYPGQQQAEALTYQDAFKYDEVYSQPGRVNVQIKRSLNDFLNVWLRNLIAQGHIIKTGTSTEEPA